MNNSLVSNKWYPHYKGANKNYTNPYPTPQSILRAAVGSEDYKFVSETVTTDHIRAAVIMPLDVPFQHLLADVPWGMAYKSKDWRMLVVSTVDPYSWIELARASGAIAWLKSHTQTYTYQWEPPVTDTVGNKIRPPNSLGATAAPGEGKKYCKTKYNQEEILDDLKRGCLSQGQIADKHAITRTIVQTIAKRAGLVKRKKINVEN